MKLFKFLVIGAFAIMMSCNTHPQKPEGGYLVQGELIDYDEPYLFFYKNYELADSFEVIDGKFIITGILEKPDLVYFSAKDRAKKGFSLYLDNTTINVKVDYTKDKSKEPEAYLSVTGSPAHDLDKKIDNWVLKAADEKYAGSGKMAHIKYKTGQFFYFLEAKPELINTVSLEKAAALFKWDLSTSHFPVENAQKLASLFKDKFAETEEYKIMMEKIEAGKKRETGVKFIDYVSKDTEGKEVKISDYYGKSYVLVDLWASWCGPCRAENPHYTEAMKQFKDKGFQIFSISFDENKDKWTNAIKEDKIYDFVHVSDLKAYDNLVAKTYKISGIPDNFLLDSEGKIIDNGLRGEELLKTLEHLYSKE